MAIARDAFSTRTSFNTPLCRCRAYPPTTESPSTSSRTGIPRWRAARPPCAGLTAKIWIGRLDLVEHGQSNLYQRNRKAVWFSRGGNLPMTSSSLRSRIRRSRLRNLRSRLRNLGSRGRRRRGSHRRRHGRNRRRHGRRRQGRHRRRVLPGSCLEPPPCSPCRRHKTSQG